MKANPAYVSPRLACTGSGPQPSPSKSRASTTPQTLTTSPSRTSFSQVRPQRATLQQTVAQGFASDRAWQMIDTDSQQWLLSFYYTGLRGALFIYMLYCPFKWHNNNTLVMCPSTANATEPDFKSKDWVFLNYTYKRFEGLTQRGTIPAYMKAGKAWHGGRRRGEKGKKSKRKTDRHLGTQGRAAEPRWCWKAELSGLSVYI